MEIPDNQWLLLAGAQLRAFDDAGSTIREKYCSRENGDKKAIMFPRAPNLSNFIDVFNTEACKLTKQEKKDKKQQDEYEVEVEVFRALEEIDNVIVLHGLKYTHGQFKECVPSHTSSDCKKKDEEMEGECDFVVVGDNFLAVLEVKSPDMDGKKPEKMIKDRYKESIKQRERTSELIKGVFEQCHSNVPFIFEFSSFNRLTQDQVQTHGNFSNEQKKSIILKHDLIDFKNWWTENVLSEVTDGMQLLEHRPINVLLGLWTADIKTVCNPEKCSLTHCILDIDEQLKSEKVTRVPKAPINKGIKGASPVFKDYLGVECLTAQQSKIFKSGKNFLWIDGPAGTGKSVLIIGKILDIYEEKTTKVTKEEKAPTIPLSETQSLLVVFGRKGPGRSSSEFYEPALDKANVRYISVDLNGKESPTMTKLAEEEYKVAILYYFSQNEADLLTMTQSEMRDQVSLNQDGLTLTKILSQFGKNHHIFIDDAHCMFSFDITDDKVCNLDEIKNSVEMKIDCLAGRSDKKNLVTWVSWDILQFYTPYGTGREGLSRCATTIYDMVIERIKDDVETLSINLRNTVEIADLLGVVRNEILYGSNISLPQQKRGHYIHGFVPKIYVIARNVVTTETESLEMAKKIIACEKEVLKELKPIDQLGIISCYRLSHRMESKGRENDVHNIASVEWPAVISNIHNPYISDDDLKILLRQLYMKISRARVYSVVVLSVKLAPKLVDLLEKLRRFAKIIYVNRDEDLMTKTRFQDSADTINSSKETFGKLIIELVKLIIEYEQFRMLRFFETSPSDGSIIYIIAVKSGASRPLSVYRTIATIK